MKKKLLILAFALTGTLLFSQSQPMAFEYFKTTDGSQNFFYKNITKTDGLGNVYVAGATTTSNGTTDILLAKKNSAGVTLWTRQYNGTANFHDFATGMIISVAGDVYITGAVSNNTTTLTQDLIVIKYNSAGTQQWAQTYNGTANGNDSGKELIIDGNGDLYVTGGTYNTSGNYDFLTIKYNSSGTQLWVNTYNYTSGLDDVGYKLAVKGTTIVYVSGGVTQSANNYKYNTISLSATTGSLTGVTTSTATSTTTVDIVSDFVTDATGNIYLTGAVNVVGQGANFYIVKMNSTLGILWTYTFNGSSNLDDIAKGIDIDASSNVYVTSYSTSSTQGRNITTVKLNSSGAQ